MFGLPLICVTLALVVKKSCGIADCGMPSYSLSTDQGCGDISVLPQTATTENNTFTFFCQTLLVRTEAVIDYCPVGTCQANSAWSSASLSCGSSECVQGPSTNYTGRRTCTVSGRACKRWDTLVNTNYTDPTLYPGNSTADAANYCRDPGGTRGSPWCFTVDGPDDWETCDIPNCAGVTMGQGTCPNNYCGDPDKTVVSDHICAHAYVPPHDRSAGSTMQIKCHSLLLGINSNISFCPVMVCRSDSFWSGTAQIGCGANECYNDGQADLYTGRRSCTVSGLACQSWDDISPHNHTYSLPGVGAHCRDPNNEQNEPWCFTIDPGVRWEVCGVPECSNITIDYGTCTPPPTVAPTTTTTVPVPVFPGHEPSSMTIEVFRSVL